MSFKPSKNLQIIEGKLIYIIKEYTFDFEPWGSADCSTSIGYIELMFNSKTRLASHICGCHPYMWEFTNLEPPITKKTGLMIDENIESGDAIRVIDRENLRSYFDPSNGWVCIGELSTFEDKEAIEFARNTIVVLKDGEIVSLWLKPVFK